MIREIFETNQADLQHATEELSGFLKQNFKLLNDNLTGIIQKVQDKCRYCEVRRKVLLDRVHTGL